MVTLRILDEEYDEIIENISLENAFSMINDYCIESEIDEPKVADIVRDANGIVIRCNNVTFKIEDYMQKGELNNEARVKETGEIVNESRIKNGLIKLIKMSSEVGGFALHKWEADEMLAWLEKQGTPNQTSIWKHWKDGIAGNGKGKLIYLIKNGNDYLLSSCLGFECDYIELSELDNLMLEKQGNSADNVEPKFHTGDCVVDNCGYVWKIEGILNQFYILEGIEGGESRPTIEWVNKTFHLWTIADAKDGDVLACNDEILLFKNLFSTNRISLYCWYNGQTNNFHNKEVTDTLFLKARQVQKAGN